MNSISSPLMCLAICVGLDAQSKFATSPSEIYAGVENFKSCSEFGSYAQARYQRIDGNMRGKAMTISGLSFRPNFDSDLRTLFDKGLGRRWSSVTVWLASSNVRGATTAFAANLGLDRTRVLHGSLSWPDQALVPKKSPQDWSVEIPFSSSFAYSGLADLAVDVTFAGGALNNGVPWVGKVPYLLDTFSYGNGATSATFDLGRHGSIGGCFDSSSSSNYGARANLVLEAYGPNSGTNSNKYFVKAMLRHGPKSTPAFYMIGGRAAPTGWSFPGVSCNKVHFQANQAFAVVPVTTNILGGTGFHSLGFAQNRFPYSANLAGQDFVGQVAWADTRNGHLRLSSASWTCLPAAPVARTQAASLLQSVIATTANANTGALHNSLGYVPLMRYHH